MSGQLGVLVAVALSVAACSGGGSGPAPGGTQTAAPGPSRSALIQRADLAPCPPSESSTVSGGLPDITLPCLGNGPAVHLAGLRGTPTVLNIWGSWCGPCQREATYLSQANRALGDKVRFLGVDTEDRSDSALDFDAHVTPPVRYPSVVDDNKQVLLAAANAEGPPVTLFVASDGRVVGKKFGPYLSTSELTADIARYLGVQS